MIADRAMRNMRRAWLSRSEELSAKQAPMSSVCNNISFGIALLTLLGIFAAGIATRK